MAEFLNLQSNIENNIDDRFDFEAYAKYGLKLIYGVLKTLLV